MFNAKSLYYLTADSDNDFWKIEMKPKLVKFYMNCLLLKILDRCYLRSMSIRDPEYITKARKLTKNLPPKS